LARRFKNLIQGEKQMTDLSRRAALGAAGAALAAPAIAQATYPTRPITVIVPFAAGGPTDTVARLVAEIMGRDLGQTLVIENVGGAGGTLGAQRVAAARPDGYTLLLHHIGMGTTPSLYRRLAYDPVNGFEPIGLITEVPMTIVVKNAFPARTLAELIQAMRTRRDAINLANAGVGAASHLCGLLLQAAAQAQVTTVPYRGTAPAMNDLLGGTVDVMCDQTTNTTEQIRAAPSRLAVTTARATPPCPICRLPPRRACRGFEVSVWHGLYARGTRRPRS
jgi:tripartite-type tricarboxylate transporter receptor subunit TctC